MNNPYRTLEPNILELAKAEAPLVASTNYIAQRTLGPGKKPPKGRFKFKREGRGINVGIDFRR